MLLKVSNPEARAFYEIEAARESWSSVELERQVGALLFERLVKSKDKKKVRSLSRHGQRVETPADVIKEPFVLEFLGLDERAEWRERDLEQAIIDRIEQFLLELGELVHTLYDFAAAARTADNSALAKFGFRASSAPLAVSSP